MKQVQFDLLTVLCKASVCQPVHEKMQLLHQWYTSGYGSDVDHLQSTQIVKRMACRSVV